MILYRQALINDDRASECSSTTSSKPPIYPLTPTGHVRHGYSSIGLKQRELRAKLHKTRYAQSLRQTNTSPTMSDYPSSRHTPTSSPHRLLPVTPNKSNVLNNEKSNPRNDHDDENDSIFSEFQMNSTPTNGSNQNDARLPPPIPPSASNRVPESKLQTIKNLTQQTSTTLSMEERRVLESIDRLDRQLRDAQVRTRSNSNSRMQKNQKR